MWQETLTNLLLAYLHMIMSEYVHILKQNIIHKCINCCSFTVFLSFFFFIFLNPLFPPPPKVMFTPLVAVCALDKSQHSCLQRGVSPVLSRFFYLIRSVELTFNLLDKFQVSSYSYRNPNQDMTQPISPYKPEHLIRHQSERFLWYTA